MAQWKILLQRFHGDLSRVPEFRGEAQSVLDIPVFLSSLLDYEHFPPLLKEVQLTLESFKDGENLAAYVQKGNRLCMSVLPVAYIVYCRQLFHLRTPTDAASHRSYFVTKPENWGYFFCAPPGLCSLISYRIVQKRYVCIPVYRFSLCAHTDSGRI